MAGRRLCLRQQLELSPKCRDDAVRTSKTVKGSLRTAGPTRIQERVLVVIPMADVASNGAKSRETTRTHASLDTVLTEPRAPSSARNRGPPSMDVQSNIRSHEPGSACHRRTSQGPILSIEQLLSGPNAVNVSTYLPKWLVRWVTHRYLDNIHDVLPLIHVL